MESKKARRKTGTAEDWVYEAELKDTVEDVSTVLRSGLCLKLTYSTNVGGSQGSWSSTFGRQYVSCQLPKHSSSNTGF
jgi:hypothetical protein